MRGDVTACDDQRRRKVVKRFSAERVDRTAFRRIWVRGVVGESARRRAPSADSVAARAASPEASPAGPRDTSLHARRATDGEKQSRWIPRGPRLPLLCHQVGVAIVA